MAQSTKAMETMLVSVMTGFAQTAQAILGKAPTNIDLLVPGVAGQAGHKTVAPATEPTPLAIGNGTPAEMAAPKSAEKSASPEMSLEDFEKQNEQLLTERDQKKKKVPTPKGEMKRPAASSKATKPKQKEPVVKDKATKSSKVTPLKLGCLRCRGSRNGCVKCHDESFTGLRLTRQEWRAQQQLHNYK